ncbi:MAG TPA: TRAP transporter small permease, partial [Afifellaceae bacterium]|nr:TRAP transporter small permease [Afifellaceae bacterium]
ERLLERLLRALAYGGGAILFGLMLLVIYEVLMRYFFGRPFRGGYEFTELAMALIVAFALPYTAITNGHVSIDLFGRWLDRPSMRWLNALVHLTGALLLALVAWRAATYALGSYRWGDLSNMMRIPKYPFQLATAASAALFALVLLLEAAKALHGPPERQQGAP